MHTKKMHVHAHAQPARYLVGALPCVHAYGGRARDGQAERSRRQPMGCGASSASKDLADAPTLSFGQEDAAPRASAPPRPTKYSAPLTAAEAAQPVDLGDDIVMDGRRPPVPPSSVVSPALTLQLPPSRGRSNIVHSGGSSVTKSNNGAAALQGVSLGALHKALDGEASVSLPQLEAAVKKLLPAGQAPPPEVFAALFRAWDTDGSGLVDKGELVAGCQALCAGDEKEKLRLAFSCFDADGDGHLTQLEVAKLLRGSIASSVTALHAGFEFAGEGADLTELEDEAGAAGASLEEQPDGTIRVTLTTAVGPATITVPRAALDDCSSAQLSADAFVEQLVQTAISLHDTDGNATIEADEFLGFVRGNAFLSVWFGFLADGPEKTSSWRDAHLA